VPGKEGEKDSARDRRESRRAEINSRVSRFQRKKRKDQSLLNRGKEQKPFERSKGDWGA